MKNITVIGAGTMGNGIAHTFAQKDLLWINPKDDWNKIYINLTETVNESVGAENFSVFIKMQRTFDLDQNKLDFDNIRIIHYEK